MGKADSDILIIDQFDPLNPINKNTDIIVNKAKPKVKKLPLIPELI